MRTFFKVTAMGAVIVSGSALGLWLGVTGRHALAGLALAGMFVLTAVVIWFIRQDTESAPIRGEIAFDDDSSAPQRPHTMRRAAS